jgi:hypothetical protein
MTVKSRKVTTSGQPPAHTGDVRPAGSPLTQAQQSGESSDVIDGAELLRILEENQHIPGDPGATANLPRLRRMPDGIEVVERRMGAAVGQWVLRVRCQCGRSWFEIEAVQWATCPRCGLLVRVDIEAASPSK